MDDKAKDSFKSIIAKEEQEEAGMLICPITHEPIMDPLVDPEGFAYERAAIMSWVSRHQTSPMTRSRLSTDQLSPLLQNLRIAESSFSSGKNMQLFLRTLHSKTRVVYVSTNATVQELKQAVSRLEGIPSEQQRLMCDGKQLQEPTLKLSDYQVKEHSTIFLLLRLRGGLTHSTQVCT